VKFILDDSGKLCIRNGEVMMNTEELSNLEIRNLLLETLAYEGDKIDTEGKTFKMYGYQGSQTDLFRLLNGLLIEKEIRSCKDTIYGSAWGCGSHLLYENSNINLSNNEILKVYQEFNNLLNQGIISPGAYGSYGTDLSYFHVTSFGMECIKQTDILPYDQDGYLEKLRNIDSVDEWVVFYVKEALQCFNANCVNSSMINIGLAGEVIIEELTSSFLRFIKKDAPLYEKYKLEIEKLKVPISFKYKKYLEFQKKYLYKSKDSELSNLMSKLDKSSSEIYAAFTRLNRNEFTHPNEIIMDRIKVLMFFITFVDYCERQYLFINFYKTNSEE